LEENNYGEQPAVTAGRKALLEIKDLLTGVAFPFIITLVISSTILVFASYSGELAVSIIATVGGEAMLIAALIIFGRANGSAAYKKTALNSQKRELGSKEEQVLCRTGEYAVWKGIVIGLILCVPFLIFQTIELCYHNLVCSFCLQYMCGWAYYPFSYMGEGFQTLNYILIIVPVGAHTLGYWLGKLKQEKLQRQIAETNAEKKGRKR